MSQQIIQLINSLSRAEKRYVHLNLKAFSFEKGESKFLHDFNKLEKISTIKPKKNNKNVTGNTTRLYYKILDILYLFHQRSLSDFDNSVKMLRRAKLLVNKGFYNEGIRLLDKTIYQNKNYDHLVKMEAIELRLNSAIKFVDINYLQNQYLLDKDLLQKINSDFLNLLEFESMEGIIKLESSTLYFFGSDHQITHNHHHLLSDEALAFHPMAKIYFNKANAFLALKRADGEKALIYAKRTIELFELFPDLKKQNPIIFLKSIRNHCIVLMHLKKYAEAELFLNEIEPSLEIYKNKSNDLKNELFTIFCLLRTDIIISNNSFKDNSQKIKFFEKEFNLYKEVLKENEKSSTYLNFAILYLNQRNYRQSLKYTIEALNASGKIRKDIYQLALFCELSLHFLLQNFEVLHSKLAAYKRYIAKETMFDFERKLPLLLKKIISDPHNLSNYQKLFNAIESSLVLEKKEVYKPFIAFFYMKLL